jgi:hypothetical protein
MDNLLTVTFEEHPRPATTTGGIRSPSAATCSATGRCASTVAVADRPGGSCTSPPRGECRAADRPRSPAPPALGPEADRVPLPNHLPDRGDGVRHRRLVGWSDHIGQTSPVAVRDHPDGSRMAGRPAGRPAGMSANRPTRQPASTTASRMTTTASRGKRHTISPPAERRRDDLAGGGCKSNDWCGTDGSAPPAPTDNLTATADSRTASRLGVPEPHPTGSEQPGEEQRGQSPPAPPPGVGPCRIVPASMPVAALEPHPIRRRIR